MKNPNRKMWHVAVIVITLAFLGLNALPSYFGSQEAITISQLDPEKPLPDQETLFRWLTQSGLSINSLRYDPSSIILTLNRTLQQSSKAKRVLQSHLNEQFEVKIVEFNASPKWLKALGVLLSNLVWISMVACSLS